MDSIFQRIEGVTYYIDEITWRTTDKHLEHLEEVLQHLLKHSADWTKCKFWQSGVTFLGYQVDADGIHTTEDKLQAIVQALALKNVPEL